MDPQTKSAIKQLVLDLRHTLEGELAIVLKRYGLFTDRKWSLKEPPTRLTDEAEREIWQRIVAVIRRGMREGRTLPDASVLARASQDYVRESAFTFLNRLVGLKCLEVQGIIDEVITTRDIYGGRSKAHRDYRDEHPRQARAADDALPACLEAVCRRVNDELIGYLFDPDDDHSLVWPRYAVLKSCIEKINALRPAQDDALDESVWAEDEIIGWIYQFYNAEEKVAIRKRGKPQTPHDVAVINQFFTPRWVVKFLVDNTLGRLWLEMHPDSERVRAKCDYLVPEPLPADDSEIANRQSPIVLDPDSPINNPHAAPRREAKPVTRIRLLDPACGTMHFGHYACEVFDAMYCDARDWGEVEIEDVRIPSAILEYNLFGVDIDRRAVQLAALSLFMKARTMHPQARVRQVNLVVADATLPDSGVKKKFLARYSRDKRVQQAFAQVLDDMDQVAQVGSLLRVEERLRELLTRARHAAVASELDPRRQHELPGMEPDVRQMGLAELVEEERATEWMPHYTLQEMRDDLRDFAREALQEHDLNAQLFTTEAGKAVHLLDVLMGEYDVVVMNPPYTETTFPAQEYIDQAYPNNSNNLYTAFADRATTFIGSRGYIGAITSSTFLVRKTYEGLRRDILMDRAPIVTLADLGWDVLDDAQVETAAFVFGFSPLGLTQQTHADVMFIRVSDETDKPAMLKKTIIGLRNGQSEPQAFPVRPTLFRHLPHHAFAYSVSRALLMQFDENRPLDPSAAYSKTGIQVPGAKIYYKYFWEVSSEQIGLNKRWIPLANGGAFSPFYRDNPQIIDWRGDGRHFRGRSGAYLRNERFYFREGLTWSKRTNWLHFAHLPSGHIFSHEGNGLFPKRGTDQWYLLAVMNSRLQKKLINMICAVHKTPGYVARLPYKDATSSLRERLGSVARRAHDLKAAWDTGNEICTRFTIPWLLQISQPQSEVFAQGLGRVLELLGDDAPQVPTSPGSTTLTDLLDRARTIEDAADARLQALQAQIDEAVYDLYEISPADRALIERELGDRPPELVWPKLEGKSDEEKRREHVMRLFSYYARQAVRQDEDGIVPLAGCATREPYLIDRVRAQLEGQFGPNAAYQLEQDAAQHLGRPVEEWLHRYFFGRFHVKLYKKRPILWHLSSPKRYFAVMVDYHRLTRDTLPKVQTLYLWPQMEAARTRLTAARADQTSVKAISDLEDELADLEEIEKRLAQVIDSGYDPDIDDGVKTNLLPLQAAGLLPVKKVV